MSGGVNILHRFWGGKDMPEQYQEYGRQWSQMNPGWGYAQWSIADTLLFPELSSVFDSLAERDAGNHSIEYYVQVADVMGYALVERYGGVYVNCDFQPLRPLSELPVDRAWASYENTEDWRIVNAAIGSPVAHDPFWRDLLDGLPARYFANPTAEMVETTGPAYLTDFARTRPNDLQVLPVNAFNPVHWKQISPGGDASGFEYPAESFGLHHWGHKKSGRSNRVEGNTQ